MINLRESRYFEYPAPRQGGVTVYQDFDDKNKWYILPEPVFSTKRIDGRDIPEFSLVKYRTASGDVAGNCTFIVELQVSKDAIELAREPQNLGPAVTLGQFDWLSADTYFYFRDQSKAPLNVTPSMIGSNRAAFSINLSDDAAVNDFVDGFGPGGVSPFRIEYDVVTLSKCPAVDVTVTYDSVIAFEYEKKVKVKKNVWGKVKSRKEYVKANLRNTDAAKVDINWGTKDPGPELTKRVTDWAYETLESLINKAIDDVMRTLGDGNVEKFSMAQTASFTRVYSENQVIDFAFQVVADLPSFNEQQWPNHYSEIDNRSLSVAFTILDSFDADSTNPITAVELTAKYPVNNPTTTKTNVFLPDGDTTWTFEAPGDGGPFDPQYEYSYTVRFQQGQEFNSGPLQEVATEITLPVGQLGVQFAKFFATNIDFDNLVDFLLLNVTFDSVAPEGLRNQERKITQNNKAYKFPCPIYTRGDNAFSFQLVYVMQDGNRLAVAPRQVDGPQNRELVYLTSPFQEVEYGLKVWNNRPDGPNVIQVNLLGTYDDVQNGLTGISQMWDYTVDQEKPIQTVDPKWSFAVLDNPNGSYVTYTGDVYLDNGSVQQVQGLRNQTRTMTLLPEREFFGVVVDPQRVAWDKVLKVTVDLWRYEQATPEPTLALLADDDKIDSRSLIFERGIDDVQGKPFVTPIRVYTFQRPAGVSQAYYYRITYAQREGDDTYVDEHESESGSLTLPQNGHATEPVVHRVLLPASQAGARHPALGPAAATGG